MRVSIKEMLEQRAKNDKVAAETLAHISKMEAVDCEGCDSD